MSDKSDIEKISGFSNPNVPIEQSVRESFGRFVRSLIIFTVFVAAAIITLIVNASSLIALLGPVAACCLIVVMYAESFRYAALLSFGIHTIAIVYSQGLHPGIFGISLNHADIWLQCVICSTAVLATWITKPMLAPSTVSEDKEAKKKTNTPKS